jgi:hypothetical protein
MESWRPMIQTAVMVAADSDMASTADDADAMTVFPQCLPCPDLEGRER